MDSVLDVAVEQIASTRFMGGLSEGTAWDWANRGLYRPAFQPPIARMVLARNGEIWLQEMPTGDRARWMILDAVGDPKGRVSLPTRVTVLLTDGEHVWGSELDELDVPYLVRYRVQRGTL
jgi:hypothetical protein